MLIESVNTVLNLANNYTGHAYSLPSYGKLALLAMIGAEQSLSKFRCKIRGCTLSLSCKRHFEHEAIRV